MKKVLIPGGTGAMGVYVIPELRKLGYMVDVTSRREIVSDDPGVRYIKADFRDLSVCKELLQQGYDGIVDFMIYNEAEFKERMELFLSSTDHYISFSSYRVYANEETPITERSPRLLDVSKDPEFISCDAEYSLYKARIEDVLKGSKYVNWTTLRPSITFSKTRYQLVTLEADVIIAAAKNHVPVLLPAEAMDKETTLTWAGDVGKMIAKLLFNPAAMREIYHPTTSEHHTWAEIAEYYKELIGLQVELCDNETYLNAITNNNITPRYRWQLELDRLFDRVMDNSKVLEHTGMEQSQLSGTYDALKRELAELPAECFAELTAVNRRMLDYLAK